MGNMIFNKRLGGDSEITDPNVTYRVFPSHMYGVRPFINMGFNFNIDYVSKYFFKLKGPLGLGDPHYRELSKMELDPMITQRMRDISRADLCTEYRDKLAECGKNNASLI